MSQVDFKKFQRRMSLSLCFPNFACQVLEKAIRLMSLYFYPLCRMSLSPHMHVTCHMSNLGNAYDVLNVDFRGHNRDLIS